MDWIQYTDIRYLLDTLNPHLIPAFILGAVYGGVVGASIALKKWWIPAILMLLPAVLAITSLLLPALQNDIYRLFFLGVPAIAVIAFAYWLAR